MRGCVMASVATAGALLLLGGAPAGCDGPTPPRRPPEDPSPTTPAPPSSTLGFVPAAPVAGEAVEITGGPIAFKNGCQGIEKVEHTVTGQKIEVRWTPKAVAPDAICTMALHDDPVVATVEGLTAGTYQVVLRPSGGSAELVVKAPSPDRPAAAEGKSK